MTEPIKSVYENHGDTVEVLWTKKFKTGYILQKERVTSYRNDNKPLDMTVAYNHDGDYMGGSKDAHFLCNKCGIKPELIDNGSSVCSIGFNEEEQKWYGWSHRAMYGFGVGSEVKVGDCGFTPKNEDEFLKDCHNFWGYLDGHKRNITSEHGEIIPGGAKGVWTRWIYSDDEPNEERRGQEGAVFSDYPEDWGRGEWKAETLEDAKQMAIDFSNGVS